MANLFETLKNVLEQDDRFVNEDGELLRNNVIEKANKLDADLLNLLFGNAELKAKFFVKVGNYTVFDQKNFMYVISNREFLPDSYTRFKQNVGLATKDGEFLKNKNDIELVFPYKDCVLEVDTTDTKKVNDEIFFNSLLASDEVDKLLGVKVLTNAKRYVKGGEEKTENYLKGENLFIKGNNLLALSSLSKIFAGQIKLMYWDVLYNTSNDKVPYNDSFKHSSWLVMMKNRIEQAIPLLSQNGVFCVQCDDNEMAYLKVLCDEIFGRDKFMTNIVVKMSEPTGFKMGHAEVRLPKLKEYVLVYKMTPSSEINTVKIAKGKWDDEYKSILLGITKEELDYVKLVRDKEDRTAEEVKKVNQLLKKCSYQSIGTFLKENGMDALNENQKLKFLFDNAWRIFQTVSMPSANNKKLAMDAKHTYKQVFYTITSAQGELYVIKGEFDETVNKPRIKLLFANDYLDVNVCDLWTDIKTTGLDNEGVVDLHNGKKPEALISRIITMFSNEGDYVLDAYLGSGTTAAVAMKLGRKFIGIEQLTEHVEKAKIRLKAVLEGEQSGISETVNWQGGGSFVYCELAKLNQNYVEKIEAATTKAQLTNLKNEIIKTGFISCKVKISDIDNNAEEWEELSIEDKKKFLMELLDKNMLYVNYSDMDDADFAVKEEDKKFTRSFYGEE